MSPLRKTAGANTVPWIMMRVFSPFEKLESVATKGQIFQLPVLLCHSNLPAYFAYNSK